MSNRGQQSASLESPMQLGCFFGSLLNHKAEPQTYRGLQRAGHPIGGIQPAVPGSARWKVQDRPFGGSSGHESK